MKEKLTRLYNTLATVETKGASTKTMADCLRYIEEMVAEIEKGRSETNKAEDI